MAAVDELTSVYRRDAGIAELEHDFSTAHRTGTPLWICFADVVGLKITNDRDGHRAGDRILQRAADRIRAQVPCAGIVVRYGGDEFVFAVLGLGELETRAAIAVMQTAAIPDLSGSVTCGLADASRSSTLAGAIEHADRDLYRQRREL